MSQEYNATTAPESTPAIEWVARELGRLEEIFADLQEELAAKDAIIADLTARIEALEGA